jgi:inner membrane transporter RhtA
MRALSGLKSISLPPVPAVLLGMLSVQGGAAIAKGMFAEFGEIGTVFLRISISALVLLIVFRPSLRTLSKEQWLAVIPYGALLGIMNLVFYLALGRIPLGLAVTLEFTGPLAVAVLGSRRSLDLLWVTLAAAGVLLITPISFGSLSRGNWLDTTGVLLALAAGVCWALYIIIGGRVSRVFRGGEGVATGMIFATMLITPFALGSYKLRNLTSHLLMKGLGVAVLSSALPYSLEMIGLRNMPARTFGILLSLEPAIGAISGLIFLNEHLSPTQWLAVALVISASAGSSLAVNGKEFAPEA